MTKTQKQIIIKLIKDDKNKLKDELIRTMSDFLSKERVEYLLKVIDLHYKELIKTLENGK